MYLSNSVERCQEWIIADINHDNTSGTVDLISKYALHLDTSWALPRYTAWYDTSQCRTYLNSTYLAGFTADVQNSLIPNQMTIQKVPLNDKVKVLSVTELGASKDYDPNGTGYQYAESRVWYDSAHGSIYPIFGSAQCNPNTLAVAQCYSDSSNKYYTGSYLTCTSKLSDTYRVYRILNTGIAYAATYMVYNDTGNTIDVRVVIRF